MRRSINVRWRRRRPTRLNFRELVGVAALALVVGTAAFLERRSPGPEAVELAAHADASGSDPASFVAAAGRAYRVLLLGDQPGRAEPKRLAASTIEALARRPGLAAVVLELSTDDQPVIDRYLTSRPEALSYLVHNLRSLNEPAAVAREYVEILRTVWRLNDELDAGRNLRVVAADSPGWPPPAGIAPASAAERFAERDGHMADLILERVLGRDPNARILVFASNPHVLRSGPGQIRAGLGTAVEIEWLGARLSAEFPGEVYSIFVDTGTRVPAGPHRTLGGSRAFDVLRRELADATAPFAVAVDDRFDFLGGAVTALGTPGILIDPLPRWASMRHAVDAYVFTGVRGGAAD